MDNSGLLGVVLPAFQSQAGVEVQLVTPGSGIALKMLADGNADAIISHAPAREAAVLDRISGAFYRKIMFNDFVLVGPPADPAGVDGAATVEDAMRRIARSRVRFISRGDCGDWRPEIGGVAIHSLNACPCTSRRSRGLATSASSWTAASRRTSTRSRRTWCDDAVTGRHADEDGGWHL